MTVKVISHYTRGRNKQPMAMVVIHTNGRSFTRHCVVRSDGSLVGYWPGHKLGHLKVS